MKTKWDLFPLFIQFTRHGGMDGLNLAECDVSSVLRGVVVYAARIDTMKADQTPKKAVYLFVVEGFADWEPAHALAELRRHGRYRVETVGLSSAVVHSMGGIGVLPRKIVSEVDPADVAVFIVPGAERWEHASIEPELERLLKQLDAEGVPIAAICAATVAISKMGLLHGRRHTSNGLKYLRSHVAGYSDADKYVDAPAVRDGKLITASGLGDVEFARELFEELGVLPADQRALWAQIFRNAKLPERRS